MNVGIFMCITVATFLLSCAMYLICVADERKDRRILKAVIATAVLCIGIILLLISTMIYGDSNENQTVEIIGYSEVV